MERSIFNDHLKICVLWKIKLSGQETLAQIALRSGTQDGGKVSVESYTFNPEVARKELAAMISLHEYPLCMVEHIGFRRFVSALQPLFKMITRNIIRTNCYRFFTFCYAMQKGHYGCIQGRKKESLKLHGSKSRIAITSDMWTSQNQKRGYMAVTGHFIDNSWKLRNIIMTFIYVPAPHTGEVICEELYDALVEWNIDEKISTVTLDNCTTNNSVITELIKKIGPSKLMLEGILFHMRSAAHILNLIVKDGLEVILSAIKKIRDSVAFWTATPKRVEKFEEMAKFLKVPIVHKLGLDCKTRWNSTYKMLSIAIPYEAVFSRASCVEKLYDCAPRKNGLLLDRLKMFDEITKVFSGTDYVTANIQLLKICEAKVKITKWSECRNPIIQVVSKNMIEKFDKYWKDIQGPMGIATVLDPRFKVDHFLGIFETLLGLNSDQ
ncbi:hypothetical protein U9M48_002636 [Paspalum notatum var. saurae]|uniref:hAT-like transposase RNase-H fold domain-containing protein n=1 Tax=Paspalum notatum var. saurae TaxID=547442 RepID=A0AAQ3PI07_PASNO